MKRRLIEDPIETIADIEKDKDDDRKLSKRELRELEKYSYRDFDWPTRKAKRKKRKKIHFVLPWKALANLLIIAGVLLLVFVFEKPVIEEIKYFENIIAKRHFVAVETEEKKAALQAIEQNGKIIVPGNYDFSLVIPKIDANSKIIANVDPFKKELFLPALKEGVAHAKWTAFPGQGGNIYLFAHSTDTFYNVGRYNAVFFLLDKLENGDEIDIYFLGKLYKYYVTEKTIVSASEVKYLKPTNEETLTLQTCYPPGTTLKRLIVRAKPKL